MFTSREFDDFAIGLTKGSLNSLSVKLRKTLDGGIQC